MRRDNDSVSSAQKYRFDLTRSEEKIICRIPFKISQLMEKERSIEVEQAGRRTLPLKEPLVSKRQFIRCRMLIGRTELQVGLNF